MHGQKYVHKTALTQSYASPAPPHASSRRFLGLMAIMIWPSEEVITECADTGGNSWNRYELSRLSPLLLFLLPAPTSLALRPAPPIPSRCPSRSGP